MPRKFMIGLALLLTLAGSEPFALYILRPLIHWDEIRGDGYVTPAFAAEMQGLRGELLLAAARYNRPARSGMSDAQFAELLALILYNEHDGWFEDLVPPVRQLRPAFQWTQDQANLRLGADYSLWPSNLRPSVALEILEQRLPLPQGEARITLPASSSKIDLERFPSQGERYAAISAALLQPPQAIDLLAANLARGVERARYERVPVSWQALAAWHNQGIVRPDEIAHNALARSYILRAAQYRARAHALISG